jgi:hypothetical protein
LAAGLVDVSEGVSDCREGFGLRREVLEHGVERAVVKETLLVGVAEGVGMGDGGAAGLHETVVEKYHAGSGLETRVQPIEPARWA